MRSTNGTRGKGWGRPQRWALGAALAAAALVIPAAARAQGSCTFTDENGKTVTWPNCQPPAATTAPATPATPGATTPATAPASTPAAAPAPSAPAAKSFPFPGEPQTAPTPQQATPTGTPAQGTAPAPGAAAGKRFPFPGEDPGQSSAAPGGMTDAGSSGSSSSSDSSSSSSSSSGDSSPIGDLPPNDGLLPCDDDPAAKAAAKRRAEKARLAADKPMTSDQREEEDLRVASFYMDDQNYRGAYLRAQDAVSISADDPEAQLALAEAARKLGKFDEALEHYKKCLELDPVPKSKKTAQNAIKQMAGK